MATETKEYIPDTSHADYWIDESTFVWHGMKFQVLPDFTVVRIIKKRNGDKAVQNEDLHIPDDMP